MAFFSLRPLLLTPHILTLRSFHHAVAHNLAYGRPDASREEIEEAARRARIHDAVTRMPSGYETIVGERGLKLSGGEKQRVAIGRALLKDAPVLLCDEATSAVDTVTEAEIFAALRSVAREPGRQRTCIMIAHRLSTVVDADLIVVLRAGRVVETGTHATLLALAGEYAQLWAMQQASSLSEILPAEDGAPSAAVVPSRGG
jgi:ATP-binding cassette subfamily B protein